MRTALVTGVCGGIGAAVARRLHGAGWSVIGVDRLPAGPPECAEFVSLDVGEWRDLAPALTDLVGDRRLDLLVNNAGVQVVQSILELDLESLPDTFAVNTFAPFVATKVLAPALAEQGGSIVNVSSIHASATSPGMSAYAASKAALVGMTRAAALDLAPLGVRVNAVLPGAIDTAMLREGLAARGGSARARLEAGTPLGRIGLADEVAHLVEYLGDPERSAFVTGQTYVIDGGAAARLGTE